MGAHIISRSDALQRGVSDAELQRLCKSGAWKRLSPGLFTVQAEFEAADPIAAHRLLAESLLRASALDAALSHQSAGVMHRVELWNTPLDVVHMTRNRSHGGRKSDRRHVHSCALHPDDVTEIDGLRVTSIARTILDLTRSIPFEQAIVAGDNALHTLNVTSADLEKAIAAVPSHPGNRRSRRVLDHLDGRSESVGESRSRVLFIREQLPVPEMQADLFTPEGLHLGRVDFLLEKFGVVGEFDGKVKYGRLVPEGQTPADVLWAEKTREDAIRAMGWQVVRWTWDERRTPEVIVRRILDAIERARLSPAPRGYVRYATRP